MPYLVGILRIYSAVFGSSFKLFPRTRRCIVHSSDFKETLLGETTQYISYTLYCYERFLSRILTGMVLTKKLYVRFRAELKRFVRYSIKYCVQKTLCEYVIEPGSMDGVTSVIRLQPKSIIRLGLAYFRNILMFIYFS